MKIKEINKVLKGKLLGNPEIEIKGILPPEENKKGYISVVFEKGVKNKKFYAIITDEEKAEIINFEAAIIVEDPKEKLIELLKIFEKKEQVKPFIHPSSVISESASISKNVYIGPYCVIEDGVIIKENVKLTAFVYIGKNSVINENTIIYPFVSIEKNVKIGRNCIIHSGCVIGADGFGFERKDGEIIKIPQVGGVEISDNVEIGANVCIDRATIGNTEIKEFVKIDNLCQIAHNVKIGERTMIASQTGIAGSTEIGKDVLIGGQVGIRDHVKIGNRVILTAKAGIGGNIPDGKIYSGFFAREHRLFLRAMSIFYELPKYWDRIKKLIS